MFELEAGLQEFFGYDEFAVDGEFLDIVADHKFSDDCGHPSEAGLVQSVGDGVR